VDADSPGEIAFARVLSRSGQWVVLHGAALVTEGPRRIAVIVEPAHPARITPLLMSAYGLTEREQEVTRLVPQGDSTAQIAECLVVSPHAVQEHLKNVFEKTGVRSRRELIGKVILLPLRAARARQRTSRDRGAISPRRPVRRRHLDARLAPVPSRPLATAAPQAECDRAECPNPMKGSVSGLAPVTAARDEQQASASSPVSLLLLDLKEQRSAAQRNVHVEASTTPAT
jgi:DNA-binding CsgD family transcriptional regulator